jgi:Fungal specific transcription factor domain
MNEAQILGWFWEAHTEQVWLFHVMDISAPTPTLRHSLRALAVTRYGRSNGDEQWLRQGKSMYSEALGTLQKTLGLRPSLNETLASARCLVFYEFLESTSESPNAWETHLSGIEKLLQFRGRPKSILAEKVFEDCRYPLMCKAIMRRERSPFSKKEWLVEGRDLCNCGFRIAAMLAASERGEDVREQCVELYGEVKGLEDDMHRWAFEVMLLLVMERFGLPAHADQEKVAGCMLDLLRRNIMGDEEFRPGRTLFPLNLLIWYYRHRRQEKEECLRLKSQLTGRGYLFTRDINKGRLLLPSVLRDAKVDEDSTKRC